jgi:hypothetical protein
VSPTVVLRTHRETSPHGGAGGGVDLPNDRTFPGKIFLCKPHAGECKRRHLYYRKRGRSECRRRFSELDDESRHRLAVRCLGGL